MKHLLKLNIVVLALTALVMVGCNTNDVVDPGPKTAPAAPTNLMAKSVSETKIGLKWTASTGSVIPTGYKIIVREKGAASSQTLDAGTSTVTEISSLTEGKIYEFSVYAVNDTAKSAATAVVEWAPARRATGTFKLYSSNNTTNGSGLAIVGMTTPAVLKISQGDLWDICFDDKTAGDPLLGSPGQSRYVDNNYKFPNGKDAKVVYLATLQYPSVNSIDEIYETSALMIPSSNGEKMLKLSTVTGTTGFGFVIGTKNADNSVNFSKIVVKRVGGNLVQGTGADSFVECEVSYQYFKDVPYALRTAFENYNSSVHAPRGKF
jgi:hypothetical protein